MNFNSYYKMQPKVPYAEPSAIEPKRPVALPKAPSIKINTKGSGTPRPSISGAPRPSISGTPRPSISGTSRPSISGTPRPSISGTPRPSISGTPRPSMSGTPRPSVSGPVDGQLLTAARKPSINLSKAAPDTPVQSLAKRPLQDKDDGASSSAAKRPKTETPTHPNGLDSQRRKGSHIVTLKTSNPKRLALVLGQRSSPLAGSARTSLPGMVKREPEDAHDIIVAKPARKPLPSAGESARRPLPTGGSSMSPPPPKMTIDTNHRVSPAGGQAGSPPPPTPGSATGRPKIKIIRKPQPGASSSPPAP